MEEIEVKFLNIDRADIEAKLAGIGAQKEGDYFYRRRVFDYPDLRLNAAGAWIRVVDEGRKVRLAFKQRLGTRSHDGSANDAGMKEVEVEVSDFEKTAQLLLAAGLAEKFYEENKRTRWRKEDVEFDIDTWPMLEPYLEIEAPTWERLEEAIGWLGLDPADKKIFSTHQVYKLKGIDELDYQRITFDGMVKKEKPGA